MIQSRALVFCRILYLCVVYYMVDSSWEFPNYNYVAEYLSHRDIAMYTKFTQNVYNQMYLIHHRNIASFLYIDPDAVVAYSLLREHMCLSAYNHVSDIWKTCTVETGIEMRPTFMNRDRNGAANIGTNFKRLFDGPNPPATQPLF